MKFKQLGVSHQGLHIVECHNVDDNGVYTVPAIQTVLVPKAWANIMAQPNAQVLVGPPERQTKRAVQLLALQFHQLLAELMPVDYIVPSRWDRVQYGVHFTSSPPAKVSPMDLERLQMVLADLDLRIKNDPQFADASFIVSMSHDYAAVRLIFSFGSPLKWDWEKVLEVE